MGLKGKRLTVAIQLGAKKLAFGRPSGDSQMIVIRGVMGHRNFGAPPLSLLIHGPVLMRFGSLSVV